uniref:Uncharacterized protein n=1 Tax=Rhizophora mucronata TaxID=61149 RepID=A0A2P2N6F0_RHIMU
MGGAIEYLYILEEMPKRSLENLQFQRMQTVTTILPKITRKFGALLLKLNYHCLKN